VPKGVRIPKQRLGDFMIAAGGPETSIAAHEALQGLSFWNRGCHVFIPIGVKNQHRANDSIPNHCKHNLLKLSIRKSRYKIGYKTNSFVRHQEKAGR
jgi:hypothetical protein